MCMACFWQCMRVHRVQYSMLTGRGHCMHVGVVTYEGVHALHTRAAVAYGVGRVMRAVRAQVS